MSKFGHVLSPRFSMRMNADKIEKTLPNLGPIYPFILMFINTLTKEKTNEQIFCFRSQRDLNALIF